MVEILISWDHLVAIMTADVAFRSWNSLPFLEPGLLTAALVSVPGQHVEHDALAAVWADLRPPAAGVLVDVHLVEAHGQLTELALNGALLAFLGLLNLQQVLRQALLTRCAPHLLVPAPAVLFHRFLALRTEDLEVQTVGPREGQVARGPASFAVPARLEVSLHVLVCGVFLFRGVSVLPLLPGPLAGPFSAGERAGVPC